MVWVAQYLAVVSNMPNAQSKAVRRSEDNLCPTRRAALCRKPPVPPGLLSVPFSWWVEDHTSGYKSWVPLHSCQRTKEPSKPSRPRPGQVTAPSAPLMQVGSYFDT